MNHPTVPMVHTATSAAENVLCAGWGAAAQPRISQRIVNSPLMKQAGFCVLEGLLDKAGHELLLDEAVRCSAVAHESNVTCSDAEEMRGGSPARRFLSAPAGPVQDAFYQSAEILRILQHVTGLHVARTGGRGTYTYYARPGDYLAIHRDIETCDLAVITCLHDTLGAAGHGGALCLYPNRLFERLSAIRSTPDQGVIAVRLHVGQTLLMLGGLVPHAVLPVMENQIRIVSILCYQIME